MAYQSVVDKALARIRGGGRGKVFSAGDFLDLGKRASVDQALSRLAKRGLIRRLGGGLYDYPETHSKLGLLSPTPEEIARAMSRRSFSKLQPSGAASANALGLSTQVPSQLVYRTTGASKHVRVGRQLLEFRHTSPKKLAGAGTPARAVIEALRHLGRKGISNERLATISRTLSASDKKHLNRLKKTAPSWMHSAIDSIVDPSHGQYR